ncbi:MAG: bifunctional folylpolyglutamate synthase/dihydrofolate synthase [Bacteroidetes bacterium]|nr:bifunctional folylpolyglutamate synthase/dihydrofolate synthase [Bacteroidota bacterium]
MTYSETLDYIYSKLPMYSRIGIAAYKKDLGNISALCHILGNPQEKIKCVHIAGTNGKGSVSHMIASVLQSGQYKTGLYTSPHLKDFRERIKINGALCSEQFVIDFIEKMKPHIEAIKPSFFEITVAMAFDYFANNQVDIAIIETGLGGRLDSTNIITPIVSVITQIGYDHKNMLGDTLKEIAGEKAGIIKENIPVIIGEMNKETFPVFETVAREKNAPFYDARQRRYVEDWENDGQILSLTIVETRSNSHEQYQLDLTGIYQVKNILPVLEAIHQLQIAGFHLSLTQIKKGLSHVKKNTGLHGRWEKIHHSPDIILDVAHNEDGINAVKEQLSLLHYDRVHIIFGMVNDKDTQGILATLPPNAIYYFTKASIPRAMNEEELIKRASLFGLKGKAFSNIKEAMQNAMAHAHQQDLILVCGSVFLVAEVSPD